MITALLFAFASATIPLPRGFQVAALASADFNGDGRADFAVASQATSQVIIYFADNPQSRASYELTIAFD